MELEKLNDFKNYATELGNREVEVGKVLHYLNNQFNIYPLSQHWYVDVEYPHIGDYIHIAEAMIPLYHNPNQIIGYLLVNNEDNQITEYNELPDVAYQIHDIDSSEALSYFNEFETIGMILT